jgi:hypothetical protein
MPFDRSLIDLIETTQDQHRYCRACSAPSVVHTHDNEIWVECAERENPRSRLRQWLYRLGAHDHILVADLAA